MNEGRIALTKTNDNKASFSNDGMAIPGINTEATETRRHRVLGVIGFLRASASLRPLRLIAEPGKNTARFGIDAVSECHSMRGTRILFKTTDDIFIRIPDSLFGECDKHFPVFVNHNADLTLFNDGIMEYA